MSNKTFFTFLLMMLFLEMSHAQEEEQDENQPGTLIISYFTDDVGSRLDRIHFWLIDENNIRRFFPLKGSPVQHNPSHVEKTVVISDLSPGQYTIQFILPNTDHFFEELPPRQIRISGSDVLMIEQQVKVKELRKKIPQKIPYEFIEVPAGKAIVGDPFGDNKQNERPPKIVFIPQFAIGKYEVTNLQYAKWLNRALAEKKVFWDTDKDRKGEIVNERGQLICKTFESNPLSQIMSSQGPEGTKVIHIAGKENYPVILVTYVGALTYCLENGSRLPTEAEWEKAAGMAMTLPGMPLKKYRYGFGQDSVARKWANYKENDVPLSDSPKVLTTPVGFYNGINSLPLQENDTTQVLTANARSPVGAFDMSGNVWEWVQIEKEKDPTKDAGIIKGGCYDSLPQGIRVAERLSVPAGYCDIYTGFRAAKDRESQ